MNDSNWPDPCAADVTAQTLLRKLTVQCEPFFLSPPRALSIEIGETESPTPDCDTTVHAELRDENHHILWQQSVVLQSSRDHRQTLQLPLNVRLEPGRYTLGVASAGSDVLAIQDFIVTEPGFAAAVDGLREALQLHAYACKLASLRQFDRALPPLLNAAHLFTAADATECAIAAWRDVAYCHLELENPDSAAKACRSGLWTALIAAYECTPAGAGGGLRAARGSEPFPVTARALECYIPLVALELHPLIVETGMVNTSAISISLGAREQMQSVNGVLRDLVTLGQSDEVFRTILRSLLSDPQTASTSYECLVAIDPSEALTQLTRICDTAVSRDDCKEEIGESVRKALRRLSPSLVYSSLPIVARRMSPECRSYVIPIVLDAMPVDAVVSDDEWLIYEAGRTSAPVAALQNDDDWSSFLNAHFARASFADARAALEDVA